jgi:hypothetical protein
MSSEISPSRNNQRRSKKQQAAANPRHGKFLHLRRTPYIRLLSGQGIFLRPATGDKGAATEGRRSSTDDKAEIGR